MTECERLVEDKFIKDGLIKLYIRYADDTLRWQGDKEDILNKEEDIDNIIKQSYSFNQSIQFSIDRFKDEIIHYLDIKNNGCGVDFYYKTSHTGHIVTAEKNEVFH